MALFFQKSFRPICCNSSPRFQCLRRPYSSAPTDESTSSSLTEEATSSTHIEGATSFNSILDTTSLQPEATSSAPTDEAPASSRDPPPTIKTPYFVHRSTSNNFPIYLDYKRGGNLLETRLRKLEGNLGVLREEIIEDLNLAPNAVTINQLTKHIIIKGHVRPQLVKFLKARNF